MKRCACMTVLLLLILLAPFQALADFQLSFSTDSTVSDVILMSDDNSVLGTVVDRRKDGSQIVWTLNIATDGADSGYLYTKDQDGNWLRGSYLSGLSLLAGADTGYAFGKPWEETTYPRRQISIRPLAQDERVQSRCGPARTYHGAGAYKTYKMLSTDALFVEDGYVLVDLSYQTVGRRILYFPVSAFYNVNGVPTVTLDSVTAYTAADVIPTFGPGGEYDTFDEAAVASGTRLAVFFEEDGWVFAEFESGLGTVRAWIPVEDVEY